jgi:hypothetical protein
VETELELLNTAIQCYNRAYQVQLQPPATFTTDPQVADPLSVTHGAKYTRGATADVHGRYGIWASESLASLRGEWPAVAAQLSYAGLLHPSAALSRAQDGYQADPSGMPYIPVGRQWFGTSLGAVVAVGSMRQPGSVPDIGFGIEMPGPPFLDPVTHDIQVDFSAPSTMLSVRPFTFTGRNFTFAGISTSPLPIFRLRLVGLGGGYTLPACRLGELLPVELGSMAGIAGFDDTRVSVTLTIPFRNQPAQSSLTSPPVAPPPGSFGIQEVYQVECSNDGGRSWSTGGPIINYGEYSTPPPSPNPGCDTCVPPNYWYPGYPCHPPEPRC